MDLLAGCTALEFSSQGILGLVTGVIKVLRNKHVTSNIWYFSYWALSPVIAQMMMMMMINNVIIHYTYQVDSHAAANSTANPDPSENERVIAWVFCDHICAILFCMFIALKPFFWCWRPTPHSESNMSMFNSYLVRWDLYWVMEFSLDVLLLVLLASGEDPERY